MEKEGEDEMESRGGEVGTVCLVALVLNEMMHFQSISGKKVPARNPTKGVSIYPRMCVLILTMCVCKVGVAAIFGGAPSCGGSGKAATVAKRASTTVARKTLRIARLSFRRYGLCGFTKT